MKSREPPQHLSVATTQSARAPLPSLQVMRGFAAIAVVIYHTHLILSQSQYGAIDWFGNIAGKGWTGVAFFFVLSGFIIPYAHHADIGRPSRATRYIWRRFTRVYPIYWVLLTLYIVAAAFGIGHADFDWIPANLASAYLLVKVVAFPHLPLQVAWTLFYEIAFYAGFLLLILHRMLGTVVLSLWMLAIIISGPVLGHDASTWYIHSWNLYFLAGGLGYLAYRRWEGREGVWLMVAGLALLVAMAAAGLIDNRIAVAQTLPRSLVAMALPFVMILVGGALADRRRGWQPPAVLALLGDASYAMYLVHSPAISLLAQLNYKLSRHLVIPAPLLYLLVMLIAIAAGVVVHLMLERPLLSWIRRRSAAKPDARVPAEV